MKLISNPLSAVLWRWLVQQQNVLLGAIFTLIIYGMAFYEADQNHSFMLIERTMLPIIMLASSYGLMNKYPRYRVNYGLVLVMSLLFTGFFCWTWLTTEFSGSGSLLPKIQQFHVNAWYLLMTLTFLYCVSELVIRFKFTSFVKRQVLPFNKAMRLSRDETLGRACLLYGEALRSMTQSQGVLLGQMHESCDPASSPLLHSHLEGNGLSIAPPRSGKFIATLSALLAQVYAKCDPDWVPGTPAGNPLVSIDPKGQAYCVWGRRRAELGRISGLLDPFGVVSALGKECNRLLAASNKTPCFDHLIKAVRMRCNPLDIITEDSTMVQKIDAMIEAFIPHLPTASATELHFNKASRRILAGFIAWVCVTETGARRNLCQVYDLINQPETELMKLFKIMSHSTLGFGLPKDMANLMLNVDDEERGSFYSTTTNAIDFLKYPEMRQHLSASDFDLNDLVDNKLDIFVVVPQHLLDALRTWVRLWVTLPLQLVSEKRPKKRIIMAIDELKALGFIKPLSNAYNLTAGYGISIWGCTQALSDLEDVYGDKGAKSMITCSQVVQFFNVSPADLPTQQYVSSIIGDTTVLTRGTSDGKSTSFGTRNSLSNSQNNSLQETRQRLIAPEETPHLPENSQLLFIRHSKSLSKPIYCYKALYFKRPEFAGLYDPDPYQHLEKEE